jgi:hypothetical protein
MAKPAPDGDSSCVAKGASQEPRVDDAGAESRRREWPFVPHRAKAAPRQRESRALPTAKTHPADGESRARQR